MLAGGLAAMIIMMVQITRMSLKVKKPKLRIILRNIRSASSLIVLFGVSHLVTFLFIPDGKKLTPRNSKHLEIF